MCIITTTTFVACYYPDQPYCTIHKVINRDPHTVQVPRGAYCFRYFDEWSTVIDSVTLKSGKLNYSPVYFYGGRLLSLDDVIREMPQLTTLIRSMQVNGYERIIKCPDGTVHFWTDEMVLIEPKS